MTEQDSDTIDLKLCRSWINIKARSLPVQEAGPSANELGGEAKRTYSITMVRPKLFPAWRRWRTIKPETAFARARQ